MHKLYSLLSLLVVKLGCTRSQTYRVQFRTLVICPKHPALGVNRLFWSLEHTHTLPLIQSIGKPLS